MSEMEPRNAPLMTVIITTVSGGGSMRVEIEHLKKQTVAADLEIIILGPPGAWQDGKESNLGGF